MFNIILRGKRSEVSRIFEKSLCDSGSDVHPNKCDSQSPDALQNLKTAIHGVKVVVKANREQAVIKTDDEARAGAYGKFSVILLQVSWRTTQWRTTIQSAIRPQRP